MNLAVTAFLVLLSVLASSLAQAERLDKAALAQQSEQRLTAMRRASGLDANHSFQLKGLEQDALRQTHIRYRQLYRGLRIWGGEVITHTLEDGRARWRNRLMRWASTPPNSPMAATPCLAGPTTPLAKPASPSRSSSPSKTEEVPPASWS